MTRRFPPDSVEKVTVAFAGAQVDLNPHQIDAALFAFNSPLSKGALLADEVGLGKTIEAGLMLSQKWAERKRNILIITPASLRKQWYQELTEKFFLPCRLLESKSYNAAVKQGETRPFEAPEIIICSYHFAKSKADDIKAIPWDLVVIDEAHWLRNVYKPSNVIANTLKAALAGKDKLLLTATPLQNSLLELFGLVSFIDEHTFGDLKSFVLCTAFRARTDRYPNLTVKKISRAVLARCEWGHDDYSLQVENLPKAPPPKGQMGLFDEDE
ncbi:DEAD/DEAH box helicase [Desulfosarcina cetonica]|uniref:DEAD/DEAH box helicase n=1 Tax=Desulfosarcina cetonica TaxID=90730 RepID=UPI0006D12F2C|nr:DEAD/DEAH box helicase [Desulfosarcina cetonica]